MDNTDRYIFLNAYQEICLLEQEISNFEQLYHIPQDLKNIIESICQLVIPLKQVSINNLQTLSLLASEQ